MAKGVWFAIGAVAGFAVGYFVGKHVAKKQMEAKVDEPETKEPEQLQPDISEEKAEATVNEKLSELVSNYRPPEKADYTNYNVLEDESDEDEIKDGPRVIDPAKDDEDVSYRTLKRTYYADGTVADENGEELSDDEVDETIGLDNLEDMGEYDDDFLLVRNDELQVDYAIYAVNEIYQYPGGHHDPDIGLEDDE